MKQSRLHEYLSLYSILLERVMFIITRIDGVEHICGFTPQLSIEKNNFGACVCHETVVVHWDLDVPSEDPDRDDEDGYYEEEYQYDDGSRGWSFPTYLLSADDGRIEAYLQELREATAERARQDRAASKQRAEERRKEEERRTQEGAQRQAERRQHELDAAASLEAFKKRDKEIDEALAKGAVLRIPGMDYDEDGNLVVEAEEGS